MDRAQVVTRGLEKADLPFIYATWLRGAYWGSPTYFQKTPQDLFFRIYAEHIAALLERPGTEGVVAVLDDAPHEIKGFAVLSPGIVRWIYVKKDYRGKGIASLLLSGKELSSYSGSTAAGHAIAKKKGLIFNPLT